MPKETDHNDVIELVDDGTGTFVPSGKVKRKRKKKKEAEPEMDEQFDVREHMAAYMPQQFMEQMAPLMERRNFRGAKSPADEFLDGMEMGSRLVNRVIGILQKLEKGTKVR